MNSSFTQPRSFFCRNIINKYRKGRRNSFIFPILIFKKNSENAFGKKIYLDFLFRLQLHIHNLTLPLIVNSSKSIKRVISRLDNEISILESKVDVHPSRYANVIRNTLLTMPPAILWKFYKTPPKNTSQRFPLTQIHEKKSRSCQKPERLSILHLF